MGQLSKFSTESEKLFLVYISQKYDCCDWLIFTVESFSKNFLREGQDLDHKMGKWHNMKVSLLTGNYSKLSCTAVSPSQSAPTILVLKTWVGLWPCKKRSKIWVAKSRVQKTGSLLFKNRRGCLFSFWIKFVFSIRRP